MILADLDPEQRILEVGAGLCLTALFLKQQAFKITALEPALGGFGIFEHLRDVLLAHFSDLSLELLPLPAAELNPGRHGTFDLIFSNYVIEHIPDWRTAISSMASLLAHDGRMIHSAPNYTIPYEPHYGTPVFRHIPNLSRRLFLPNDADLGIWQSLNFITARQIRKFCRDNTLHCRFREALLYHAFMRIEEDPLFKQRHQGLAAKLGSLLIATGIVKLLRYIPATLATPMIVEIGRADAKAAVQTASRNGNF